MPFARHATSSAVLAVALAVSGSFALGACGSRHEATGFCAAIRHGHAAFNSTDQADASAAVAEFGRVSKSAPPALAPDLQTVNAFLGALYRDPASLTKDPAAFQHFAAAVKHVDTYLHQTCGIHIPPPGKFL